MLHVKLVQYIADFKLWIEFDDGSSGEINLSESLTGPVFEPLKNPDIFSKVSVDPELQTIIWPNGADFAPEYLQQLLSSKPQAL